ncbi:sensor histidine kinase [Flavobacterium sp. N1718]|uniref:sensor histidine kinase n=1 Tax=Flavobacterium sp. N1718 TaxID=2986822 RepID=UPI002224C26B|nr:histidine kinase [Flavobacterium sp. N1718]
MIPIEIQPRFWQTWGFYLLGSTVFFGLLFVLLLYLLRRRRDKRLRELLYSQKVAELELQAVKAQMNPHFVYNCLNSIQYLLLKEDYPNTERYLGAFSRLIRATLHYSEQTFLAVREEVAYLELYLSMEKLRFRERFSYHIRCAEGVNPETKVPSLLIQPFVENALKHGIGSLPESEPGLLEVLFEQKEADLCVMIRDNGPGLSKEDLEKTVVIWTPDRRKTHRNL